MPKMYKVYYNFFICSCFLYILSNLKEDHDLFFSLSINLFLLSKKALKLYNRFFQIFLVNWWNGEFGWVRVLEIFAVIEFFQGGRVQSSPENCTLVWSYTSHMVYIGKLRIFAFQWMFCEDCNIISFLLLFVNHA